MDAFRRGINAVDRVATRTPIGKLFRLEGSGSAHEIKNTRFTTEIRAGLTTFFTMAYIISVNSTILADSGGTCVCDNADDPLCLKDSAYQLCTIGIKRDIITATAAISALASCMFGLLTNMPVALAPGMGLNAYFAYQVVGFHGSGPVSYQLALAAVFIEGFVFVGLALLGMRQWLVRLLPASLKVASGCGIGLFLSLIGLSYSAGIGAVAGGATATPLDLAGCQPQYLDDKTGVCLSHKMRNPTLWLGVFCGGILTAYLMAYKVKSAIIIGIALVSIISWPRSTAVTFFPHTEQGDAMFDFFKKVATFHPIKNTLNAVDWSGIGSSPGQFSLALFTFLYVDIIDCTATLYSMARFCGVVDPVDGSFPRSTVAYTVDALSISIGALFGTSPVTAFIESGAGIAEGGKTGLTAFTTGICFFISIFFSPIFASIPPWATGCTLIIVGCLMMRQVNLVNWRYIGDALPAFVTLLFIPFSYSIAYGIIAGIMTYTAINLLTWLTEKLTFGRIIPADKDTKEYWTYKPEGSAPWFIRAAKDPQSVLHPVRHHREVTEAEQRERAAQSSQDRDSDGSFGNGEDITGGEKGVHSNMEGVHIDPTHRVTPPADTVHYTRPQYTHKDPNTNHIVNA